MGIIRYLLLTICLRSSCALIITTDATWRAYKGTVTVYEEFSQSNITSYLSSPYYDSTKNTTIFTSGFGFVANGTAVVTVIEALLPTVNAVLWNWENQAYRGILGDADYPRAATNAITVGKELGTVINTLVDNGLCLNCTTLVGFSLGAHVMGNAGDQLQTINKTRIIPMIIGLDPAGPLFTPPFSLSGLNANNARCVNALHTNPAKQGTSQSIGTKDFWANCGNAIQPACVGVTSPTQSGFTVTTPADMCSHNCSWKYYAEEKKTPNSFVGILASSCSVFKAQGGTSPTISILNDDPGIRGNFYFNTNAVPPYGEGQAGIVT